MCMCVAKDLPNCYMILLYSKASHRSLGKVNVSLTFTVRTFQTKIVQSKDWLSVGCYLTYICCHSCFKNE